MVHVDPLIGIDNLALTELRSSHQKLQSDAKTKESNHNTLLERIQYMEKVMGDSAVKHSQELAEAHSKIDEMHSRVAKCEVHGESLESLKKSTASLASGKTRLEEHHASLGERVDYLEKALGDSADRHALEMASAHSKLAALHSRLGDEKEARERHASNTTENIVKERSTRETHHSSLEERLTYLETYLGESADKQGKSSVASRFEQKLKSEIFDLRELINNERQMRSRQGEAITEHLEAEKRAREALEEAVAHHMANHKQSMENHEKRVKEQFGHERTARERHFDHVEALVRQEKEARSQHHETHSENLQKESTAREATHKKFHDVLQKEKSLREQHHGHVQDLIGKERAARQQMEELLNRETQERTKHHETQSELVDSLQRTVGIFDALIRKEMEERKLEMKRVWAAIDSHTHDLDSKIKAGSDTEEVAEEESRFRPRIIRSTPSLPGVVSPVRTDGSPKVVPYRPQSQVIPMSPVPVSPARILSYPTTTVVQAAPAPMTFTNWSESMRQSRGSPSMSRSMSPTRDHNEVVCGKARYNGDRAHNAEIFMP
ncbi:unnamed protein product [Effrenium voratum]|uniref:Uncharacterized protein n=1 Tax=Effrenium voratum TaxID=2562239 RepID=A0AA36JJ93_9DINO|nr:unnamed protein product [Effrenium voratum]